MELAWTYAEKKPNKNYSGQHKATEEEGDLREMVDLEKKRGQQV